MNIMQAKEQIHHAVKSYFTKDGNGEYVIPLERQRPIFLMGPPGIGKTAIMEQIAAELGVGLVTYSMTHHTRQSALGLPFIVKKTYGGREYSVSEYTMSEIIASVYDRIENDGAREGILFLDEINCVSETLAPSMLQFLQYKVFGTHRVPEGWIVVTAGNPPEYNNSVREFDIVTWDRLKRIDVEPDFKVWREYALSIGVHPAVITYLDIKLGDFYKIETTVDGKSFVTARGWVDLSDMIRLYEKNGFKVDETLVVQYLQNRRIARDFAVYYDLFDKYRSDYQVDRILDGTAGEDILRRAENAAFDERLSLLGLIFDKFSTGTDSVRLMDRTLAAVMNAVKTNRGALHFDRPESAGGDLRSLAEKLDENTSRGKRSGVMSREDALANTGAADVLREMAAVIETEKPSDGKAVTAIVKNVFNDKRSETEKSAGKVRKGMDNALLFCEKAFGTGREIVMLVTEMTAHRSCAHFISHYGCEQYFRFNKALLIHERQIELTKEIDDLELDL